MWGKSAKQGWHGRPQDKQISNLHRRDVNKKLQLPDSILLSTIIQQPHRRVIVEYISWEEIYLIE